MKIWKLLPVLLAVVSLSACGQPAAENQPDTAPEEASPYIDAVQIADVTEIEDEAVALADAPPPAMAAVLKPVASGVKVQKNDRALIDYSNTSEGYVMVHYTGSTTKRLKVQVAAATTYTYDIRPGAWTTFPLSDGNTTYKVTVFENVTDSKYAAVISASFPVTLSNEFTPFLHPNQYVNYENAPNTVAKAAEIAGGISDPLKKVEAVYNFVVNNLTYDTAKATSVQSGYLPALDSVLAAKKGICFDYAALMAGMLRSQGVPCKLVVGYAGTAYHAWVSVWTQATGWIDGVIYFDGTSWQRMDPTFISSSKNSQSVQQFVGNGSNYTQKYLY